LNLKYGDAILEVGAGILALSTQLSREGFKVTAIEPIQEGFEEINFIMNLYLTLSINDGISLKLVKSQIELCQFTEKFDYIFAFNVFEHISKPYEVVKQLKSELKQNSSLRILCPNYNFPYEPHFRRILFLRKNKAFFRIVKLFYKSRLIGIAKYFPFKLAPLIDLKIINRKIT
jgi:2-polyprenyl-3-methyl-5-hydroxy-6-metoxy-1,4-benzoquinol methylase